MWEVDPASTNDPESNVDIWVKRELEIRALQAQAEVAGRHWEETASDEQRPSLLEEIHTMYSQLSRLHQQQTDLMAKFECEEMEGAVPSPPFSPH